MDARLSLDQLRGTGKLPILPQAAALCFRIEQGQPEVLLTTTRRARRWSIPKGWLIGGLTAAQTAAQEAWEEAGVVGHCNADRLGQFCYLKHRTERDSALCLVDVFPLQVQSLVSDFPEKGERKRKWYSPKKAVL